MADSFVSLDQARDNQDFYGRRYRKREMAWEVLSQEEREDAYIVRLSFQQASGFRGEPGVEEFTISRSGTVQSRQVLSEQVRRGGTLGCGLVATGVILLASVSLAGVMGSLL